MLPPHVNDSEKLATLQSLLERVQERSREPVSRGQSLTEHLVAMLSAPVASGARVPGSTPRPSATAPALPDAPAQPIGGRVTGRQTLVGVGFDVIEAAKAYTASQSTPPEAASSSPRPSDVQSASDADVPWDNHLEAETIDDDSPTGIIQAPHAKDLAPLFRHGDPSNNPFAVAPGLPFGESAPGRSQPFTSIPPTTPTGMAPIASTPHAAAPANIQSSPSHISAPPKRSSSLVWPALGAAIVGAGLASIALSQGWFDRTPRASAPASTASAALTPSTAHPKPTPSLEPTAVPTSELAAAAPAPSAQAEPAVTASAAAPSANPTSAPAAPTTTTAPAAPSAASPAAPASADASGPDASALPKGAGYIIVKSTDGLDVYAKGKLVGKTNARVPVHCGFQFVRLGRAAGAQVEWVSEGKTTNVACQDVTTVEIPATR